MKYLLLIVLFFFVLWILRKAQTSRSNGQPPVPREPERMVRCAHCGVNQPISESLLAKGRYFCCAEHRREAESMED